MSYHIDNIFKWYVKKLTKKCNMRQYGVERSYLQTNFLKWLQPNVHLHHRID